MPLPSRSSRASPSHSLPRPSTAQRFDRLSPLVSTGWMLPSEAIARKDVVVRAVADTACRRGWTAMRLLEHPVAVAALHEQTERVAGNLVLGDQRLLDRLEQQPVGPLAAVGDEPVVRERQPLRKHQRRAGGIVAERCSPRTVAIGIHVVKPVAHALDVVVANFGAIRRTRSRCRRGYHG